MLVVICDQTNGITVPDNKAFDFMLSAIQNREQPLRLGSDTLFNVLRIFILEGKISHNEVEVWFKGKKYELNKFANLKESWPIGMFEFHTLTCEKLLSLAIQKRRQERDEHRRTTSQD